MEYAFLIFGVGFVTGVILGFLIASIFKSGDDPKEDDDYDRDEEN